MKKIKLFDLIERSFLSLKKTNKKIWIIAIIISIFSGGLIIQESFEPDVYSDMMYEEDYYDLEEDEGMVPVDMDFTESIGAIITGVVIVAGIFALILFIIAMIANIVTYYLYHSIYEATYDVNLERASLGLVAKVNFIVLLKVLLGFILFIIPGIIASIKYAPANYVLCNNPELSSKEILSKTRELSKGFKWKIFLFNAFITLLITIIMIVASPSTFVSGHMVINILDMIITFVITTFTVVYCGIFNVHLFREIEEVKAIA